MEQEASRGGEAGAGPRESQGRDTNGRQSRGLAFKAREGTQRI